MKLRVRLASIMAALRRSRSRTNNTPDDVSQCQYHAVSARPRRRWAAAFRSFRGFRGWWVRMVQRQRPSAAPAYPYAQYPTYNTFVGGENENDCLTGSLPEEKTKNWTESYKDMRVI